MNLSASQQELPRHKFAFAVMSPLTVSYGVPVMGRGRFRGRIKYMPPINQRDEASEGKLTGHRFLEDGLQSFFMLYVSAS